MYRPSIKRVAAAIGVSFIAGLSTAIALDLMFNPQRLFSYEIGLLIDHLIGPLFGVLVACSIFSGPIRRGEGRLLLWTLAAVFSLKLGWRILGLLVVFRTQLANPLLGIPVYLALAFAVAFVASWAYGKIVRGGKHAPVRAAVEPFPAAPNTDHIVGLIPDSDPAIARFAQLEGNPR